jgi:large subunit ribosomal protein L25
MERVKLSVRSRSGLGTKEARAVRARGEIPGVMYSSRSEPVAICVNARALRTAMVDGGGQHAILDVVVDERGRSRPVVIKELQLDPVRDRVIHIDLHEIRLDQPISSTVLVALEGEAHGVTMGGVLNQPTHELSVQALPADIPEQIMVDVSALEIGGSVRLADLEPPSGVTFTDDPEGTIIATVLAPISEAALEESLGEAPAEEEEAEGVEGEEAVADAAEEGDAQAGTAAPEGEAS